jgi:hypothetical protein
MPELNENEREDECEFMVIAAVALLVIGFVFGVLVTLGVYFLKGVL